MKGTLEKLRRMFSAKRRPEDDVTVSRFARSTSFKKASMRRSGRRAARKKAVVTNRGIYYVDDDGHDGEEVVGETELPGTLESQSTQSQGTISYTDWIQISDDDTLDKSAGSRNFSLEGKSVPFDSPLPGGGGVSRSGKAASESPVTRQRRSPPTDDGLPVTSTFGSSCTSGVHSMEKPRLEDADEESRWSRAGARRRQPTVVATRDNLRRSLRRLSGKRAKKAARRLDGENPESKPLSVMDDEFYRRFARLPLVYANDDSPASPTSPAGGDGVSPLTPTRAPFAFSRQNPITRWLEESEKLSPRAGFTDLERPLWSELVSRPPRPAPATADERARRPAKAAKRTSRARTPSRKSMRRKAAKVARPRVDRIRSVVGDAPAPEDTAGASAAPESPVATRRSR
ncbi:hypothetical protein FJT64_005448 [Amphibalanus amphitrite]|uniref:Uncharacterized protein n=1 Tax=Amphibalanus amphitrite TaxID=1232801 RepID=A0A6A4W0B5_AMPAM|nr:hypothetical protein FJT64_014313 [Amphibalanus amphitrite]KAF0297120.1 hypothetical protein FJT64_005448 [Amphibalanus amphitrite]